MASYYLKAAASYLDRSNISASYTPVQNPAAAPSLASSATSVVSIASGPSSAARPSSPSLSAASNYSPPARIGLWNVHRATHNSTHKLVSVWTFEKKLESSSSFAASLSNGWGAGSNAQAKSPLEKVVEILKKEVSSLSRLRHPCILEVVEPLEETRTTMVFATEPVTACLKDAIEQSSASRRNPPATLSSHSNRNSSSKLELDEVETQKGLLQVAKGLQFLHESAKLVHCNLTPDAIIINAKGDWKISGFGLSTYLKEPSGQDSSWTFPDYDSRLPALIQKNFDYLAPEYGLDEQLSTSNDMYSLGCILHAIHTHAGPPFQNHNSLDGLRRNVENLGSLRAAWSRVPDDVQEVLSQLVTRSPTGRLTSGTFLSSRYFSSNVLVSTLSFLDRDTFNSKQKEEQIQFMKGLLRVLPQFSPKVVKQKILPSLLEESRKHILLPFLLPNVFYIARQMENEEFRTELLPHLTPLFTIRDPPQSMLCLLDQLSIFQTKCTPQVFREEVMALVYCALESEVVGVLEKALGVVPGLCETLEYTHVKQVLFPKITMVFSKTTLLSVKVNTLICFHSIVKILDKFTLTEKLVPLLARIKTKEPAVMIATLAVHEEMGKKVELEAIATLILPQLWAMSIGPLLNMDQFNRFMNAIEQLSSRVRIEHTRHLAEAKRLEESTTRSAPSVAQTHAHHDEAGDFEALVKGPPRAGGPSSPTANPWGLDESFGSQPSKPPHLAAGSTNVAGQSSRLSAVSSFGSLTSPSLTSYHTPSSLMDPIRPSSATGSLHSGPRASVSHQSFEGLGSAAGGGAKSESSSRPLPTFVGLPPLEPQTSSLNHLLSGQSQPQPSSVVQNRSSFTGSSSSSYLGVASVRQQNGMGTTAGQWKVIQPVQNHQQNMIGSNIGGNLNGLQQFQQGSGGGKNHNYKDVEWRKDDLKDFDPFA